MSKWKLVPVEPTQAMIDATNSVPEGAGYLSCVRAYRAMLDAAPAWQAEPVAWVRNLTDAHPHCVTGLQFRSAADVDAGVLYTPLYATPPSDELARLRAENERLKADAARYQHLKSIAGFNDERDMGPGGHWWIAVRVDRRPVDNTLDAAIDAAMAQGDKA